MFRLIKNEITNKIGCFVARWILHNCADGLVIKRKCGAKQIIKVFSEPAYRNVIKPAIHKATKVIKVGDVVTDNDYHDKVVVTCIDGDIFKGYYLGVVATGLKLEKFEKIIGYVDLNIKK